ncbi:hypothetical protein AAHD62_20535 [Enterobacter hormaechei]
MKMKYRHLIIFVFIVVGVIYSTIMTRIFSDEYYKQSNLIEYYLLTPKPLKDAPRIAVNWYFTNRTIEGGDLQISTLNFTDIQKSEIQRVREKVETYIDNYPDRHATMSIEVEEKKGVFDLRIIHYDTNDDNQIKRPST